jgi:membrane protease YdiL (CAAX protease family)
MVAIGLLAAAMIWLLAVVTHSNTPPTHALPLRRAWLYGLWALAQQFMLQSFFFVRFETLLGSRWAVLASAALFAAAHIPNSALTLMSFRGLFFCLLFRRYRNIYPLGLVHTLLGMAIAACFSEAVMHHMRVGAGYLYLR